MTTLSATPARRKARKKLERRIRVLEQPSADTDGWAAISITVGKEVATYLVRTIPSDFAGTLGFEVEKLDDDLEAVKRYHVLLADEPEGCTCECDGFNRWGHCKHPEALAALRQDGRLPALFTARDARHEPELTDGPELDEVEYFDPSDLS